MKNFMVIVLFFIPLSMVSPKATEQNTTGKTVKEYRPKGTKGGPMVLIPKGEFTMGSTSEEVDYAYKLCTKYYSSCDISSIEDEMPRHKIYLDEYYIDKYEVSVDEYAKCVKAGKCLLPNTHEYCTWGIKDNGNYPINCVDWLKADSYCRWAGKRLPTEAEWEKAAAGPEKDLFAWGNEWSPDSSNYCDSSCKLDWRDADGNDHFSETSPVGHYPKGISAYGAMDMSGNVWEWAADWYDEKYYQTSPARNPKGPDTGEYKVIRGGAWSCSQNGLRTAKRHKTYQDDCGIDIGFRCAKTP